MIQVVERCTKQHGGVGEDEVSDEVMCLVGKSPNFYMKNDHLGVSLRGYLLLTMRCYYLHGENGIIETAKVRITFGGMAGWPNSIHKSAVLMIPICPYS